MQQALTPVVLAYAGRPTTPEPGLGPEQKLVNGGPSHGSWSGKSGMPCQQDSRENPKTGVREGGRKGAGPVRAFVCNHSCILFFAILFFVKLLVVNNFFIESVQIDPIRL